MEDDHDDFEMIEFWGQEVPPGGKPYSVEVENEPPIFHMIHVTGCALGDGAAKGPHTLKALYDGKPIALATLEHGACSQFALDFGISSSTTFVNTGPGPVFISGYITRSVQHFEGSDDDDDDDDEDDMSDSGMEDDDEEPPKLVPIKGAAAGGKKRASPFLDDEAEETDEGESEEGGSSEEGSEDEEDEDEDDEDEEGDDFDRRLGAKSFGGGSDDDGSGEGLPELSSDDLVAEAEEGSSDEDGMETGSSDEEDEGESDDDGPPVEKKNAQPKHAAQQPTTPQPAKKQKQEERKAPATAPAKVQQQQQQKQKQGGDGGGDAEAQYLVAIIEYVKSQPAPVPLAALGSRVKRPEGVAAKAKAFVLAHADKLVFDPQAQTVAVKKKK
ncbi:MAG: hypothetical protein J3K34DRAFT_35179 [Monoraphidium minutum]|nr:MAG: hypothetical protein J3K34DRAFT_35179 [Monoraphidium minutum]